MSTTRLLDFDPLTGESVLFVDHNDGTFDITHVQDVENILDGNKRHANEESLTKKGIKKGWWLYASIPNVLWMKWSKEVGGDIYQRKFRKELFKRLNHPDYQYLRTTHGRHTVPN